MTNREKLLSTFEEKYYYEKKHNFYKPKHREFLYDCIINDVYNTEFILCINGIKPVGRFVADKIEHIDFIKEELLKNGLNIEYRELKQNENDINLNNRINYILYIGKDLNLIMRAIECDFKYNGDIGEIIGYPKCCSKKWNSKNIDEELKIDRQETIDTNKYFLNYISRKNLPLLNNPFFNFTTNSISFFYPCKLDCLESLETHNKYIEVIKKDNPTFLKNMLSYFSLPILFLFPEKNNVLTFSLHFDEIFRIYFIGFEKQGVIYYKDFFILSYAFLDQSIDEAYKEEGFLLLEKLLYGNKCYIKDNNIIIEGNNYCELYEIKEHAKIIKFL